MTKLRIFLRMGLTKSKGFPALLKNFKCKEGPVDFRQSLPRETDHSSFCGKCARKSLNINERGFYEGLSKRILKILKQSRFVISFKLVLGKEIEALISSTAN